MEMHQIRYFLAVCDALNFTRAAESCNVAQPSLTRAIKLLEEELGGELFRRERNLTHLTDLGRLMQVRLAKAYEEANAARKDALSFLKLEKAPLHLGIMCTVGPLRLVGLISNFQRDNPGIVLQVHDAPANQLIDRLMAGELEVAMLAKPEELDERFDAKPLYRERFTIAFAPGHRFERMDAVPVAQINGENYLRRVNCEYREHLGAIGKVEGVSVNFRYATEREDWIQAMVQAGLGICYLPEFAVLAPGICTRPVIKPEITRTISLVTVAGRRFSPAVAAFMRQAAAYRWGAPS